jgi:hypothetical protein
VMCLPMSFKALDGVFGSLNLAAFQSSIIDQRRDPISIYRVQRCESPVWQSEEHAHRARFMCCYCTFSFHQ